MHADARIIAKHQTIEVLDSPQVIAWPDGSVVRLHRARLRGIEQTELRAVQHRPGLTWLAFDLRVVARTLAFDLPSLPRRDHDGIVLFTLRDAFPNADRFIAKALDNARAVWPADGAMHPLLRRGGPLPPATSLRPAVRAVA